MLEGTANSGGFMHHLPIIKSPSARVATQLCPCTKLWGGMRQAAGSYEVATRMETPISCQGPVSPCSQHWYLQLAVRLLTSPWESRAQGEQTVYSSLECRGRERRWCGLGEGRQCGMARTEVGCSQGLPDHVQQCSCPLLEFWGALVLLKGPVPALPDKVSSSLCERWGET